MSFFFAAVNGSTQTKTVASSHQGNIDLVIGKLPSRREILASKTMGKLINFLFLQSVCPRGNKTRRFRVSRQKTMDEQLMAGNERALVRARKKKGIFIEIK